MAHCATETPFSIFCLCHDSKNFCKRVVTSANSHSIRDEIWCNAGIQQLMYILQIICYCHRHCLAALDAYWGRKT